MLRCKNCGGLLNITNGVYICENCRSEFPVSDFAENIDVCICYIEADERGVRTKDSLIGQEIYHALERKKISSFYGRISASNLVGENYEKACNSAVNSAKIIIILGTNKLHFEKLVDKYQALFDGKTVIPVYADMDAYDIPKALNAIQALDYNKVGAVVDLTAGIQKTLGIEDEQDFVILSKTADKKKRCIWIILATVLLALIVCAVFLLIKNDSVEESSVAEALRDEPSLISEISHESVEDTELAQYTDALTAKNAEDYVKAIETFVLLGDYKDSANQLYVIYQKYEGYYYNELEEFSFHLMIEEDSSQIVIEKRLSDGTRIKISEALALSGCENEVGYTDSENNLGVINLNFTNDGINLSVETKTLISDYYLEDSALTFLLSAKSDKPIARSITREQVLDILKSDLNIQDIERMGFDTQYEGTSVGLDRFNYDYYISNSDPYVKLYLTLEDIYCLSVPASFICPEKIGEASVPFIIDGFAYLPNGIWWDYLYGGMGDYMLKERIEELGPITENTSIDIVYLEDVMYLTDIVGTGFLKEFEDMGINIDVDVDITVNAQLPCEVESYSYEWNTEFSEIVDLNYSFREYEYYDSEWENWKTETVFGLEISIAGRVNDEDFHLPSEYGFGYPFGDSYRFTLYDSEGNEMENITFFDPNYGFTVPFNEHSMDEGFTHNVMFKIPCENAEYRLEISENS